jgi:hypothetical protein
MLRMRKRRRRVCRLCLTFKTFNTAYRPETSYLGVPAIYPPPLPGDLEQSPW